MKKSYKKILLVLTMIFFIGSFCFYFKIDLFSPNIIKTVLADSLESSADVNFKANPSMKVSEDILFLSTLSSLKTITINVDFLNDTYFKSLKNNKVKLTPVKAGRDNPFEPMEDDSIISIINPPNIITNQASNIGLNKATLNGTLNLINGVTDIYFSYGVNQQNLDKKVIVASPSLIGTFLKNIEGLSPSTNYFYKACAKISNIDVCGEIISFTTI
jgi:hypothetical protein